jgi:hypothetical protein
VILGLLSRKKADQDEGGTKQQAHQHDLAVRAFVSQSELSFNLTYEGYACGAFNQKYFSILKFSDVPKPIGHLFTLGGFHPRDFDDPSPGVIGRPFTHLYAILKIS